MASQREGKYNIKAIASMLRIHPGTLRAWERRYHIVEPVRNASGHRLYSEDQVAVIRWLIEKVNEGFTIGQAVDVLKRHEPNVIGERTEFQRNKFDELADDLTRAVCCFDERRARRVVAAAFRLFEMDPVLFEIVTRLRTNIENKRESGEITNAHLYFMESFIREKVGALIDGTSINEQLPTTVSVCASSADDDVDLLLFRLFLRRRGYRDICLGQGVSGKELDAVLNETEASLLFVRCSSERDLGATFSLIESLESRHHSRVDIGITGLSLTSLMPVHLTRYADAFMGAAPSDWEQWLKR